MAKIHASISVRKNQAGQPRAQLKLGKARVLLDLDELEFLQSDRVRKWLAAWTENHKYQVGVRGERDSERAMRVAAERITEDADDLNGETS